MIKAIIYQLQSTGPLLLSPTKHPTFTWIARIHWFHCLQCTKYTHWFHSFTGLTAFTASLVLSVSPYSLNFTASYFYGVTPFTCFPLLSPVSILLIYIICLIFAVLVISPSVYSQYSWRFFTFPWNTLSRVSPGFHKWCKHLFTSNGSAWFDFFYLQVAMIIWRQHVYSWTITTNGSDHTTTGLMSIITGWPPI
jgi:hypothetical protein